MRCLPDFVPFAESSAKTFCREYRLKREAKCVAHDLEEIGSPHGKGSIAMWTCLSSSGVITHGKGENVCLFYGAATTGR